MSLQHFHNMSNILREIVCVDSFENKKSFAKSTLIKKITSGYLDKKKKK